MKTLGHIPVCVLEYNWTFSHSFIEDRTESMLSDGNDKTSDNVRICTSKLCV